MKTEINEPLSLKILSNSKCSVMPKRSLQILFRTLKMNGLTESLSFVGDAIKRNHKTTKLIY